MKTITFSLVSALLLFISCKGQQKNADSILYKEVVLMNNFIDTCIFFKDAAGDTIRFSRNFEILENTFEDTLNVSFKYIEPGKTGAYFATQIDTLNQSVGNSEEYKEYLIETDSPELYTQWLCIYNLTRRQGFLSAKRGSLRIKVYYKPKKKM